MFHQQVLKHIRQQVVGVSMLQEFKQYRKYSNNISRAISNGCSFFMNSSCAEYTNGSILGNNGLLPTGI